MKLHPTRLVVPTQEDIARAVDLCDLRIGKHFLRDGNKQAVGCVWVRSYWHVEVMSSFRPPTVLAVVCARGEEFGDCQSPDWTKAVLAVADETAVLELDRDPLVSVVAGINLLADHADPATEGPSYALTFATGHLHGSLQFTNPEHPGLVAMEKALHQLAQKIAAASQRTTLLEIVDAWGEYIGEKHG